MNWRAYTVLAYGAFILIGGMIGYAKAHSMMSLIMGTTSALIAFASGWTMLKNRPAGQVSALILAGVLLIFFASRFINSGNFMPAGLMSILSVAVLAALSIGFKKEELDQHN